jgi:hypothetical protein
MIYLFPYSTVEERNLAWPLANDVEETPPAEIYSSRGFSVVQGRVIFSLATYDEELGEVISPEVASTDFWLAVLENKSEREEELWEDPTCQVELSVFEGTLTVTASKTELTPEQAGATFQPMLAGLLQ